MSRFGLFLCVQKNGLHAQNTSCACVCAPCIFPPLIQTLLVVSGAESWIARVRQSSILLSLLRVL
jgi:hypothetical protein